jgi:hypothetical protein
MRRRLLMLALLSGALGAQDGVIVRGAQDAATLFTRAGGLVTWKCSTGMTCSWANGVFTMTAGGGDAVQGKATLGTVNRIPKITSAGELGESAVSDDGTTVSAARKLSFSPGGKVPAWESFSYSYTNAAFRIASTTATITVRALPANWAVHGVTLDTTTALAGTGITTVNCTVGDGITPEPFIFEYDAFAAVSDTNIAADLSGVLSSKAGVNVILTCTANTNWGNGSATVLTAGALNLDLMWSVRR